MNIKIQTIVCILLVSFAFNALAGSSSDFPTHPTIDGIMGVVPALENSCAAIWLAIPEGRAITGVEWFNNDATHGFPGIYFESGVPESPVALEQTLLAAENVTGLSGAWSTVPFNEPVTCASEGLYIIFRFPEGVETTGFGAGGGPAIGYVSGSTGAPGWLCSDGESWDRIGGDYGFAVLPLLVDATSGMTQLNGIEGSAEIIETVLPVVTILHPPYPNPFNPETAIDFSLAKAQNVDLSVFDIRGRLVANLAAGHFDVGHYHFTWKGADGSGRLMSSGVYFARFKAENVLISHRLVLVK